MSEYSSYKYPLGKESTRSTFEELLFELSFRDLYFDCFVDLLSMAPSVVCVILDRCREQGVNKSGLSKTRLSCNLTVGEFCSHLGRILSILTMIVKAAPRFATILCLKLGGQ